MHSPRWIWQQPDWPALHWNADTLQPLLQDCRHAQARLLAMAGSVAGEPEALDVLLQNILTSSAIEGEELNVGSLRSSLARRLGLQEIAAAATARSEGLAELMLDATRNFTQPLTAVRLYHWHTLLFAAPEDELLARRLNIGGLRGEEPMQVVSGRIDRPTVHFEAPPRAGLETQLATFLDWFAASQVDAGLDPLLRAGIAHFWFVTLHPFDDGNGRLTRALTDLALAQAEQRAIRLYAMAASILDDRKGYYRILEASQKGDCDITPWLQWFLATLLASLQQAIARIRRTLAKARFWNQHRQQPLSAEQLKVLNRMLDGGPKGFEEGISASQYQAVAKVSKATATRHLADLLDKGCLQRLPGGGRSTRYAIDWGDEPTAVTNSSPPPPPPAGG